MKRIIGVFLSFILLTNSPIWAIGSSPHNHNDQIIKDATYTLGKAKVSIKGNTITANTGTIQRVWQWSGVGLQTVGLKDLRNKIEYAKKQQQVKCDWNLNGAINDSSKAILANVLVTEENDEGFSNKYLQVVSTIDYPDSKLSVEHVIWVFSDAVGVRTQLRVKAMPGFEKKGIVDDEGKVNNYGNIMAVPGPRNDYLPLDFEVENARRYWGYYNNPGGRHDPSRDMLEEKVVTGYPLFLTEDVNWASGLSVEYNQGKSGVTVIKESPKTVNNSAHYTGSFYSGPAGLSTTGWGLNANEISTDRFRECWATWTILWDGGNDGMQLALKKFDRTRYPVDAKRDLFILSNTWGPANPGGDQFTEEDFLLKEIPALAKIGIDVMQIDDGWQKGGLSSGAKDFSPRYKNGWKTIKKEMDKYGLRFGLWATARHATIEEFKKNIDELGFISWKMDFDHLDSRQDYEDRAHKYREVMKYAPGITQFTLCPEYDDPRYGWYYFKEYGSIYFQNLQESLPTHLTMVPYQVLRQHWLMSRYFNSNKLQVLLQNPKRTDATKSDAVKHGHAYCFAMGVPFIPCFFQSGQYLDEQGQEELKTFIANYKQHREAIFQCYSFPIGDKPDNKSWSGFQMVSENGQKNNYLLLFRELHNLEPIKKLNLKFLAGKTIKITNVETKEVTTQKVDDAGQVDFKIHDPAGYLFVKYDVIAG